MLKQPQLRFFSKGEIEPQGWLKRQLRIQADGLSGHLDKIWPDVSDSRWIGGNRDGRAARAELGVWMALSPWPICSGTKT